MTKLSGTTAAEADEEPARLCARLVREKSERTEAQSERPPIPFTGAQTPVNEPALSATVYWVVTSGPGLGNWTSFPSTVVQPFPWFATNRLGRLANGVDSARVGAEVPAIVTEAQDM